MLTKLPFYNSNKKLQVCVNAVGAAGVKYSSTSCHLAPLPARLSNPLGRAPHGEPALAAPFAKQHGDASPRLKRRRS